MTTKEELETDNTPEKNRLRVAKQLNIEAYETARKSLEKTPIGKPLNPKIPTDSLPYITRLDWKQNGRREEWLILNDEAVPIEELADEPTEKELSKIEEGELCD